MRLLSIISGFRAGMFLLLAILTASCGYHTKHFMFKSEKEIIKSDSSLFEQLVKNYRIRTNDRFRMTVYSNSGEILIDPNRKMAMSISGRNMNNQMQNFDRDKVYLVSGEGETRLPMIGWTAVVEKSVFELEQMLQEKYSEFYVDAYVRIEVVNRRVFVFGKNGGAVVPIENENISLLELLAHVNEGSKGSNMSQIKIIRGDLSSPEVQHIDLSTIEGLRQAQLKILPNDVVYVKPTRNAVRESIQDFTPILQVVSSTLSLVLAFIALSR